MSLIYNIKNRFRSFLRPIAVSLGSVGINVWQIRLFSAILILAVAVMILIWPRYHWPLLLVPLVLLVRMSLNVMAGILAVEPSNDRRLDTVFVELWNLVMDTILYLPFATVGGVSLMAIFAVVCLSIIGEIIRIVATPIGYGLRHDLPMRKGSMALVFGSLGLLLGLDVVRNDWLNMLLWIVAGLLVVTILNRVWGMLSSGRTAGE